MWTNDYALNVLYRCVVGAREALKTEDADPGTIAAGILQTAQLTLVELNKPIPPSLLLDLAAMLAERGRLGSEFGDAETVPAQRYLPAPN